MGCVQAKSVVENEPEGGEAQSLEQEFELQAEGFDNEGGKGYIPRIERETSDVISTQWSVPRSAFVEYQKASNKICLSTPWLAHTRLLRYVRGTKTLLQSNEEMKSLYLDQQYFEKLLLQTIRKGYHLDSDESAREQKDIMHEEHNIFSAGSGLWERMGWRKPYLTHAVKILAEHEDPDAIVAKLTEVCDRAERCSSAQRQAFNVLVSHSYHIIQRQELTFRPASTEQPASSNDPSNTAILQDFLNGNKRLTPAPDSKAAALIRVFECVEDFLDDFKEKAFASAFIEPARFYFDLVQDGHQRDHVNVHGFNWSLALIHATLGAQVPLLPELHDPCPIGVGDFWAGLSDASWAAFSAPHNFGKDFQGIRELRAAGAQLLRKRVTPEQLPVGRRFAQPKLLGNAAVNESESALRRQLAVYLERFGHFFRAGFLIPRLFETLNAENKPEYAGFRKACGVLYAVYREEEVVEEQTLLEHVYGEDYGLRVERVLDLLAWMQVVKPDANKHERRRREQAQRRAEQRVEEEKEAERSDESREEQAGVEGGREGEEGREEEVDAGKQTTRLQEDQAEARGAAAEGGAAGGEGGEETMECQICMEERGDVETLEHWAGEGEVTGDVSSHRMCGECRARYGRGRGCPFCREVTDKQELLDFIRDFLARVHEAGDDDANVSAAVLERWQLLEMEHQAQPAAVARVAKLVLEDEEFLRRLEAGVRDGAAWLRDTAGVIFRFHALYVQGRIKTSVEVGTAVAKAVEVILAPWESERASSLHGHYFGALYMQAVVPWLMAFNAGEDDAVLRGLVQRVGKALVKQLGLRKGARKQKELRLHFAERVHLEYVQLSHAPVWGSQSQDPVWTTYLTKLFCFVAAAGDMHAAFRVTDQAGLVEYNFGEEGGRSRTSRCCRLRALWHARATLRVSSDARRSSARGRDPRNPRAACVGARDASNEKEGRKWRDAEDSVALHTVQPGKFRRVEATLVDLELEALLQWRARRHTTEEERGGGETE